VTEALEQIYQPANDCPPSRATLSPLRDLRSNFRGLLQNTACQHGWDLQGFGWVFPIENLPRDYGSRSQPNAAIFNLDRVDWPLPCFSLQ